MHLLEPSGLGSSVPIPVTTDNELFWSWDFRYRALQHLVETVLLKLAKVCLRCIHTHKHKHCLANGHTNENDPVRDSDHLKHLLPPFFCQKNSNSTSALVISRPKEFEARVFSNYLLKAFHFPPGLLETTLVHSSPRHCLHHFTCFLLHRAHIKCANTKRFWAFAGFTTRARPCSSTPRAAKPETLPTTLWLPALPKRFLWFWLVMSICSMVLWPGCPSFQPTRTLYSNPRAPPFPTNLDCVLHRWHHELVALFRWTTA